MNEMTNYQSCTTKDVVRFVESNVPDVTVLGVMVIGSSLYNLATPESDVDFMVVADAPGFVKPVQVFSDDRMLDVVVWPWKMFAESCAEGKPNVVDMLYADAFVWTEQGKAYQAFFQRLHVDFAAYVERADATVLNSLRRALKRQHTDRRWTKEVKSALRTKWVVEHAKRTHRLDPAFSSVNREAFKRCLDAALGELSQATSEREYVEMVSALVHEYMVA